MGLRSVVSSAPQAAAAYLVAALMLLAAGCTVLEPASEEPPLRRETAPGAPPGTAAGPGEGVPGPRGAVRAEDVARVSVRMPADLGQAVTPLLEQAETAAREGRLEQSAAALERALRLAPKHPWLWHRLALVRLFQGRHEEAVSLAARSTALAPGDPALQAANWRLTAQALGAAGKTGAAREAARRAADLIR